MNEANSLRRERVELMAKARRAVADLFDTASPDQVRAAEREHERLMGRVDEIDLRLLDMENPDPRRPGGPVGAVNGDGRPAGEASTRWHDAASGKEVRVLQRGERFATEDTGEVSLGGALRSMVLGPRTEAEKRALSEGTDSAGGFTVPTPLAGRFIDLMRARSHVFAAGAQTVELPSETLGIARVASDPVPAWRNEAASLAESDPSLGKLTFTSRSLGVLVKVSRELLQDSANIDAILERVFAASFAAELDRTVLFGTGTAPQPRGIANTVGVHEIDMGTNGAALTGYGQLLSAMQKLEESNSEAPTGFIMAPREKYKLAGLTDSTGQPLVAPGLVSAVPFYATSKVPTDETHGTATDASRIITGDFRQAFVGVRQDLRIEVLRERYADTLQMGFIAFARFDVQLEQPEAFAQITGVIPA